MRLIRHSISTATSCRVFSRYCPRSSISSRIQILYYHANELQKIPVDHPSAPPETGPFRNNSCNSSNFQLTKTIASDFFGEPVTFLMRENEMADRIESTITCLDSYLLSTISRGKLSTGGGDDQGIAAKAAHSSAIAAADLIHAVHDWCHQPNNSGESVHIRCHAPMVVATLLAPLLASAGSAYVRALDDQYLSFATVSNNAGCSKLIPLMELGLSATSILVDTWWNDNKPLSSTPLGLFHREIMHLHGLKFLMNDDFQCALIVYCKLLEKCPGDALALSLVVDIATTCMNHQAALRSMASVAAYWRERSRESITGHTAILGYSLGNSLIAVGLALGGRFKDAEMLAESSLKSDRGASSGVAAWALSLSYDAEGRVAEGSSLLAGFDGTQLYDDCGYLFFNSRLGGDGARFVLDRDCANADRTALRFYDNHFGRIIHYSGYHDSESGPIFRMKPESQRSHLVQVAGGNAKSILRNILSSLTTNTEEKRAEECRTMKVQPKTKLAIEDVFTWLPPTHTVLTQATLLLFRITVDGIIKYDDSRWGDLKHAWLKEKRIQDKYRRTNDIMYKFSPLTRIASCLVLDTVHMDSYLDPTISSKLEEVTHLVGCAMKIKESSFTPDGQELWSRICTILSDIRFGFDRNNSRITVNDCSLLEKDLKPFWECIVFHSAMKAKTHDALVMARSVCSEVVTLRPNAPEAWLRYSVILEALGDKVAAEEASLAAVSLGSGEGGRIV